MKNKNEVVTFKEEALTLSNLLVDAVDAYQKSAPVVAQIYEKILETFSKEDELRNMAQKDMMSLMKILGDAQLKPIGELTKMAVALKELMEASQLSERVRSLETIIDTYKVDKAQAEAYQTPEVEVVEAE